MVEEKETLKGGVIEVERIYEQPPDAISFYSDFGQFYNTGAEIVMQFYDAIPGPPAQDGKIKNVRTRLRATITVSIPHANNIGKLLLEKIGEVKK